MMPSVWLWRRKQLKKRKGKGSYAPGLVSSCFWELATGKEPRAVRREISFLLEEETWHPLRKAAVGGQPTQRGLRHSERGSSIPLLVLQNVCNEAAKYIPSPDAVHEVGGWSYAWRCLAWPWVVGSRGD